MNQSLHKLNLSEYAGFEVSTVLFSRNMETRIFAVNSDRIPAEIVEKVQELKNSPDLLDKAYVTAEPIWISDDEDYSDTEFSGVAVETYAFQDAGYIHAAVGKIVEDFINDHERVVTYVRKSR